VVARTILFAAVAVGLTMVLGTLVALLLRNLARPMRVLVTAALVAAWAMPTLTAISIWQWLFDFEFGLVNWLLTRLGAQSFEQHNWFDQPLQGFAVIILVVVWGALPFVAITLHAGLTQVPAELEEAARVDGAGWWRRMFEVTIPLTLPVIAVAALFGAILTFTDMTVVYILTRGGPTNSTQVLASWAFIRGIEGGDVAQGAAVALFLFPLLLAAAIAILRAVRRMEVL
jgi:multiple sugar transport system permease protein